MREVKCTGQISFKENRRNTGLCDKIRKVAKKDNRFMNDWLNVTLSKAVDGDNVGDFSEVEAYVKDMQAQEELAQGKRTCYVNPSRKLEALNSLVDFIEALKTK